MAKEKRRGAFTRRKPEDAAQPPQAAAPEPARTPAPPSPEPPVAEPPVAEPPALVEPPVAEPPVAEPPALVEPPVAEPPVAEPPALVEPPKPSLGLRRPVSAPRPASTASTASAPLPPLPGPDEPASAEPTPAEPTPAAPTPAASAAPADARVDPRTQVHTGRIPVRDLFPAIPGSPHPAKAVVGEVVPFSATVFREGHDQIGATLVLTAPSGAVHREPMRLVAPGTDRWTALAAIDEQGMWSWHVEGWSDDWGTWLHDAEIKIGAGIDVELMLEIGARLMERSIAEAAGPASLAETAAVLRDRTRTPQERWAAATTLTMRTIMEAHPPRALVSASEDVPLRVERRRALVGSWYELFPRSEGARKTKDGWISGTFQTAKERIPAVAAMGFDVLYLPPIHPIGEVNRKGPNNSLTPGPGDPGSPWAIGSKDGGHDAIHPDLGTIDDLRDFVAEAAAHGIEVALDFALQCAPDHPWVTEHPDWFTQLPDGTIAFAENPPKKYQDIYPINFDHDPAGIAHETVRLLEQWIDCGVQIFRVDNPHTKPVWFWEWVIRTITDRHPDVMFHAEAFTRPAMMQTLAQVGFQQSVTYYAWRNTKQELSEYLAEVSGEQAAWFRPNFWTNTPDILTEFLQFGGVPAYKIRAAIAATGVPSWAVYAGYELIEDVARPGSEENVDNEKYEYKERDWAKAERLGTSIAPYLTMLNRIRAEHPALQQLRNLSVHWSDDDAVLVFAKHLDGRFTPSGEDDTIIVVANVDPHSVRQTMVHLDLEAIGLEPGSTFSVHDLVTDQVWEWGDDAFVRLDAFVEPVHILHVRRP
ncbi:alpha-1,4-glucan--maltose-1-phosphate maltosyltransferase [Agrococcus sp. SGAir0287]|nr:alpha-1,4-glucan--maltose-1-phosphate maltosyltransferase [Agrococcus sp. SGAir0287]